MSGQSSFWPNIVRLCMVVLGCSTSVLVPAFAFDTEFVPAYSESIQDELSHSLTAPGADCHDHVGSHDHSHDYEMSGTGAWEKNAELHPCPKSTKDEPLDLFGLTCSCEKSSQQKALNKAQDKADKMREDIDAKAIELLKNDPEIIKSHAEDIKKLCTGCLKEKFFESVDKLTTCLRVPSSNFDQWEREENRTPARVLRSIGWKPQSSSGVYGMAKVEPPLTMEQCQKIGEPGVPSDTWSIDRYARSLISYEREDALKVGMNTEGPWMRDTSFAGGTWEVRNDVVKRVKEIAAAAPSDSYANDKQFKAARKLFKETRDNVTAMLRKQFIKDCAKVEKDVYKKCLDTDKDGHEKCGKKATSQKKYCAREVKRVEAMIKEQVSDVKLSPPDSFRALGQKNASSTSIGGKSVIAVGLPYMHLASSRPEAFVKMLAHEFGHKVQETYMAYGLPKGALETCLRSEKSAHALPPQPGLRVKDQIGEAFSDWFAAEYMASEKVIRSKNSIVNGLATLCGSGYPENDRMALTDPHATGPRRLNNIFGAHPAFRKKLGARPLEANGSVRYCEPPSDWDMSSAGPSRYIKEEIEF